VIPRHQCGASPPPQVVACGRLCSAAASPVLARPSPPLLMQHAPTSGPGAAGFQQPLPHVHDCPSYRDDRPPLSLEPGYHAGSWQDPVTVQCPVHGHYQPFVAGFHQTVCSTEHLQLTHPHHQFICHHQQQQPLSHVYQASYAVQSPPLIQQSQYPYSAVPASGVDVDIAATTASPAGDWYYPYVEFQHQPDCQHMSHPISTPLLQQQQQHVLSVGLARTDTDADNERVEPSERSAGDNTDISALMTAHHDEHTAAVAMATCNTGESHFALDVHCSFLCLHR